MHEPRRDDPGRLVSLQEAWALHRVGRTDEAAQAYEELLRKAPEHPDALHLLGLICLERNDVSRAILLLMSAVKVRPGCGAYLNSLGNALAQAGQLTEAAAFYEQAIAVEPDAADFHYNKGVCLYQSGQFEPALGAFARCAERDPANFLAQYNSGLCLHALNRVDEAADRYRAALSLNPAHVDSRNNLGLVLHEKGDWEGALFEFQKAVELAPAEFSVRVNLGNTLKALGRLEAAASAYRTALELRPDSAEAGRNLAIVLFAQGRLAEAEAVCRRTLEANPRDAEIYLSLGHALKEQGRLDEAESAYRRSLERQPNSGPAHFSLGEVCRELGRVDEAINAYRQAISHQPALAEAHVNLANALLRQGRFDEARAAFQAAASLRPASPEIFFGLGEANRLSGRFKESAPAYAQAIHLKPHFAEAYHRLGIALHVLGKPDDAIAAFRQGLEAGLSNSVEALFDLAVAEEDAGDFENAVTHYGRAVQIQPSHLKALWGASLALPVLYDDPQQIEDFREQWTLGIERLLDAGRAHTFTRAEALDLLCWHTNFNLHYQGLAPLELQRKYGDWIDLLAGHAFPEMRSPKLEHDGPGGRIRIGIVSDCCENHTVLKLFGNWLRKLDRRRFELKVFDLNSGAAACVSDIDGSATCCRMHNESLTAVAETILRAKLDVLVYLEVGMSLRTQALAALRLAPVQCLAWGHPVTSGFRHLDYFLSSELMEPPDGQAHYTETLVRLPHLSVCYSFPPLAKPMEPETREQNGPPIFLCSQSLFKLLPQFDALYARLAVEVPESQFWFIAHNRRRVTEQFCRRLKRAFDQHGLEFDRRVAVFPKMTEEEFFRLNRRATIVLDSFLWSGGNTSLEALACDKPIVTCPGPFMRSRHTAAILERAGLSELVARDPEDYVRIATRLAKDRDWRAETIQKVKACKMSVYGDETPVRALEAFLDQCMESRGRIDPD